MAEEHHDTDQPLVGEEGKNDQESWKGMMEHILIVVTLLANEHMWEEPAEMLTELEYIE